MKKVFDIEVLTKNIENLCRENHITVKEMLLNNDLNRNVVDNLKKGSIPSIDKILRIADYFDVSIEYLLGCTDISNGSMNGNKGVLINGNISNGNHSSLTLTHPNQDEMTDEFIEMFSKLSFTEKVEVMKFVTDMIKKN